MIRAGRRRSLTALVATCVLAGLMLSACSGDEKAAPPPPTDPPKRLAVVATTSILGDFVTILGGGLVDVDVISGPGSDPHNYKPSSSDVTKLASADVVVRNGAGLEKWLDKSLDDSETGGVVVDASAGVQLRQEKIGGVQQTDPHIWLSPVNARLMATNIAVALGEQDSAHANVFRSNERAYHAQLVRLGADIGSLLSSVTQRDVITTHRSLGYLTEEYDLDYVASLRGFEPSNTFLTDADKAALAGVARQTTAKVMFLEDGQSGQDVFAAASGAGLRPVGGSYLIYTDQLSRPDGPAANYIAMMRQIASALVNNLG